MTSPCLSSLGDSPRAWIWLRGRWGQPLPPERLQCHWSQFATGGGTARTVFPSPPPKILPPQLLPPVVRAQRVLPPLSPPPLSMSSLFLPRDSGISAGLGGEEGQKPLPCQKKN